MVTWRLRETAGWPAYLLYLIAGGLLSFGFVGAASIGLFILPFGMFLFGFLIAYSPDSRDRWGTLAGVGATAVLIGVLNWGHVSCSDGWRQRSDGSLECGGWDGRPWLAIGLVLIAVSVFLYTKRRSPSTRAPAA